MQSIFNGELRLATESSTSVVSTASPDSESLNLNASALTIALISPDELHRNAAISALGDCQIGQIREFITYPPGVSEASRMLGNNFDVVLVDLDSDSEYALELVENICALNSATVMVFSAQASPNMLVRCMRAGAREFLTMPFDAGSMAEALIRASALRSTARPSKKTGGRLLVFLGAKGGSGVTTLACNYAVSLAEDSRQKTLLIDLNLPLGDAAINLGIKAQYSAVNALQNFSRLDGNFLSTLLVRHTSGLFVLAAPTELASVQVSDEAVDRLLGVACQEFEYVVVDAGSRLDLQHTHLFDESATLYLVTQIGIPELRNSNRLIAQLSADGRPKLEIVLNRYDPRGLEIDEEHITRALTRPAQWKIPNNYAAVRKMQNTATPLTQDDSQIARSIRKMTKSIYNPSDQESPEPEKKRGFSLFR
jgi:pilus assembly protein CpaE